MPDWSRSFWTSPNGLAAIALSAVAGYFLLAEHRAHVVSALPWLILLLCPLLHVFMHRGHGHGGRHEGGTPEGDGDSGRPGPGETGR